MLFGRRDCPMVMSKFKVLLLLIILLLLWTGCSNRQQNVQTVIAPSAESAKQLDQFSRLADDAYNKTISGDFLAARQEIIKMGDMVPLMHLEGYTSLRGIKAIADT